MKKVILLLFVLAVCFANVNAQVQELVAYYPFNGNANDESGNNNHGTPHEVTLTADRFGNPNKAYYFNGMYGYIAVPPSTSLSLTNEMTLSAWVKFPDIPAGNTCILMKNIKDDLCEYGFSFNSNENTYRIKVNMGGYNVVSTNGAALNTCKWFHLLATFKYPGNCIFYINGVEMGSVVTKGNITPRNSTFTVGRNNPEENSHGFKGIVDDIRIYNYAIPVSQIQALYGEGGYTQNTNLLNVFAGNDVTIYHGYGNQSVTLNAIASGGGVPYTYRWSNGASTQSITVSPSVTTVYTVTVSDDHRCIVQDNVTVNVVNIQCGNNNEKVLVCHNGHTICIAPEAVPAHLKQGAYLGPCVREITQNPSKSNELQQNVPNPFNPVTKINYTIGENSFVTLKIYDLLGREVAVLVNENLKAGQYQIDWNAGDIPSGVYFYRLTAGDFSEMRRMILLK